MTDVLGFDEEASRRVEAIYLTNDVAQQRHAILDALQLGPGERVLDVARAQDFWFTKWPSESAPVATSAVSITAQA